MKINTKGQGSTVFSKKKISLIVGAMLVSATSASQAADFEKFYQIDTDFSYQTNPGFGKNSSEEHDVFALKITPSAQFKYADELNEYNLDLGFSIYENSNEKVLVDYVAPEITADWSRELEFGQIGLEANYNHIASRAEVLRLGIDSTGFDSQKANVENITKTGKLRGIFNLNFNAKWSMENYAEYTNVKYSEKIPDLLDYNVIGGESKLIYKNTDRFSTYAAVDYYELDAKKGIQQVTDPNTNIVTTPALNRKDSDVYSLMVGGVYTPSENIKVDFSIGAYDASGEFDDSGVRVGLNGYYVYKRFNMYWDAYRKMLAGGNGVFQINEFFIVGGTYELSEVSNLRASYIRNENKPDSEVSDFDVTYDNLSFAYEHEYEDWKGSVYVQFVGLDLDGDQRRSEVVGLTVSYDPFDFTEFRRNPLNF